MVEEEEKEVRNILQVECGVDNPPKKIKLRTYHTRKPHKTLEDCKTDPLPPISQE